MILSPEWPFLTHQRPFWSQKRPFSIDFLGASKNFRFCDDIWKFEFDFELFKIPKFMKIVKFGPVKAFLAAVKIVKRLFRFQTSFLELLIQNVKSRLWFLTSDKILESKVQPVAHAWKIGFNFKKVEKLKIRKFKKNFEIHATNNWRETKFRVNLNFSRTFRVYCGSHLVQNYPFSLEIDKFLNIFRVNF